MIPEQDEARAACKKALQLLEYMDRTEKGLSERLRQAGFSVQAAETAVEYVKSYGYLDDERYARVYMTGRIHTRSRRKIFEELSQKGIDRTVIQRAWDEVEADLEPDEKEVLAETVQKKYPEGSRLDEKQFRRLYAYLARRGFSARDITEVLDNLDIKMLDIKCQI